MVCFDHLGYQPFGQNVPQFFYESHPRIPTDLEPRPDPERAALGVDHHLRHAVGVLGHDGGRPDDGARHHHDLHLLRLLRHVQRSVLQVSHQVSVAAGALVQQTILPGGPLLHPGTTSSHLQSAAAVHFPD